MTFGQFRVLACVATLSFATAAWGQVGADTAPKAPAKKTQAPEKPRTPESAVTPEPHVPARHEEFMKRKEQGPINLLFIGDSITDFWPRKAAATWQKFEPYQPADFGVSGDRTEHVLWRIEHGELDGLKPKATVIMIGTNNVGHFTDEKPEWAAAGVKKILDEVHKRMPETKVLLLGVFPRDAAGSPKRQAVEAINNIISTYANGKDTIYLDIGDKFLDDKGELPKDVMPDKLHPSEKGYQIWYDAMWPTLDKMLNS
jgi:beta-glucosidase